MILFLQILIRLATSIECRGPNTVMAFNNECVCIDGFPFGDPMSNEGCYNCNKKCHKLSKCEYPGKCVCIPPYHGDGVNNCSLNRPHLTSISPNNGSTSGGTDVHINYMYSNLNDEKNPDHAFCRFGSLVVRSKSVSDTVIICQTPPHRARPSFLSISFDTFAWSKEDVFFNYIEIQNEKEEFLAYSEIESNKNKNIGLLSTGIICIILLSSLLVLMIKRYQINQLPLALRKKTLRD